MTKRQAAHLVVLLKPTVSKRDEKSGLPDCSEEEIARRVQIIADVERYIKSLSRFRKSMMVWPVEGPVQ